MAIAVSKVGIAQPPGNDASGAIVFVSIPVFPVDRHVEQRLHLLTCETSQDGNARRRGRFSANPKFIASDEYVYMLHQFIERLGRHPIPKKDAGQRREKFSDCSTKFLITHPLDCIFPQK